MEEVASCDGLVFFSQNQGFRPVTEAAVAGNLLGQPLRTAAPAFDANGSNAGPDEILIVGRHIEVAAV